MDYPVYPQDFDGKDAVHIEDWEINKWIRECVDGVKNGEKDYFISSGDAKVEATKDGEVIIVEVYRNGQYFIYDE